MLGQWMSSAAALFRPYRLPRAANPATALSISRCNPLSIQVRTGSPPRDNGSVSLETCGAPNGSRAGPYTLSGGSALPKPEPDAPKEEEANPSPPPGSSSASAIIRIRARAASKSGPFSGERLTGFCGTTARARLSVRVRRPGVVRK